MAIAFQGGPTGYRLEAPAVSLLTPRASRRTPSGSFCVPPGYIPPGTGKVGGLDMPAGGGHNALSDRGMAYSGPRRYLVGQWTNVTLEVVLGERPDSEI